MPKLLKFLVSTILGFLFLFLVCNTPLVKPVLAEGEFTSIYKVLYNIDESGLTSVRQDIVLKNNTANYYADKFELKIGSTKVEEVKATDPTGPIETTVNFDNNVTTISVKFNQKVIGIGKSLPWTLTYKSKELATKSGQIWEISIPRLAKSQDIASYDASVSAPITFGPIAFSAPTPQTTAKDGLRQNFTFSKDQLIDSGIAMSFGEKQVFSFKLNYYLENTNLTNQTFDVTLPPDNNYQKIVLQQIDPEPENVVVDSDNNFIAKYKLAPKQQVSVVAQGYVEVFSKPFRNIYEPLTPDQIKTYTQPQKYWETDNKFIKDKASQLKTPEEIYKFVSTYLSYSQERLNQEKIERKGAVAASQSPKDSVCMEFTDMFIAIARSAGIPAREVEGYAFTQNERLRPLSLTLASGDILHAWPEYFDSKLGWVQVDPTWGSTSGGLDFFDKLDFNHVTFIQRGISSTTPYPAGSYKKSSDNAKSVFISFAQELPQSTTTPQLELFLPDKLLGGIPIKINAQIKNVGTSTIFNSDLTLSSKHLKKVTTLKTPENDKNDNNLVKVAMLPPFSTRTYSFDMQAPSLLKTFQDTVVLSYFNSQISKPIEIVPIYNIIFLKGILISCGIALAVIIVGLIIYAKTQSKKRVFPRRP